MNKKLSTIAIALFILSMLITGVVYAQCPMGQGPGQEKSMHAGMMPNFTPEQGKAMMDLKMTLIKETDPLKTELKIKQMELEQLWKGDNPDAKSIIAKVKEINKIKEELEIKMISHRLAMYKICTPEQRKMMGMPGMGCMMGSGGDMGMGGMSRCMEQGGGMDMPGCGNK